MVGRVPPLCRLHRRRGVLTAEALFVVPVLLILTIAIIEFGILLSVRQTLTQAAIEGARAAGQEATMNNVGLAVESVLSNYSITLGSGASLIVEEQVGINNRITSTRPDPLVLPCNAPTTPLSPGNIRVTVCVSPTVAVPLAGQLKVFGLNYLDELLRRSAVVKKER